MYSPANDNPVRLPILSAPALFIGALQGWWRNLAAFLFGVSVTLALPPYFLLPFLPVGVCGLYWLCMAAPTWRRAVWDGWWFGFGMFAVGLYWITHALLVDAERFGWLVPFALLGIPGGLAVIHAVACGVFFRIRRAGGLWGVWWFAVIWLMAEWVRGHVLTGFPWNLIGYVWNFSETTLQFHAFFGVYLSGFWTVALALLPTLFACGARYAGRVSAAALLGFAVVLTAGYHRVADAPRESVPGIRLRLVQPAIEQKLKWDPDYMAEGVQKLASLSLSAGHDRITHVIWPESAMPFPFISGDTWAKRLAELVPPGGVLMMGVTRVEGTHSQGNLRIFNSVQAVDDKAQVVMAYDKAKLVPFGEFVPLRWLLPVDKITHGTVDFSSGTPGKNFDVAGLPPVRPLICYESIFPALAAAGERPAWLLNVTNDAWFGDSSGPRQHLEMARSRAVEQGVPLVRVANTGISVVVDAYGRMLHHLPLGEAGVVDSELPRAAPQPTVFARFAEGMALAIGVLSLMAIIRKSR